MSAHIGHALNRLSRVQFGSSYSLAAGNLRQLINALSANNKEQTMSRFLDIVREAYNFDNTEFYRFALETVECLLLEDVQKQALEVIAKYLQQNNLTAGEFTPDKATQGLIVAFSLSDDTSSATYEKFLTKIGFTEKFILNNFDEDIVRGMFAEAKKQRRLSAALVTNYMQRFEKAPLGNLVVDFVIAKPTLYRKIDFRKYNQTIQRNIISSAPRIIRMVSAQELFDMFTLTAPQWIRLMKSLQGKINYFPPGFFELLNKKAMLSRLKGGNGNKRIPTIPSRHSERDK